MSNKQAIIEAGTLDPAFGLDGVIRWPIDGLAGGVPQSMLELANGKLLIAEERSSDAGPAILRRLNVDGTLDTAFGEGGSVEIHFEEGDEYALPVLASHPAGGWIVAGMLSRPLGGDHYHGIEFVVRQLEDGTTDPDFGDNGIVYIDLDQLVAVDEQALAAIRAKSIQDPKPRQRPTGNAGSATPSSVVLPDGKIVLFGLFSAAPWITGSIIVRLNPDGSLDTSFNGKGFTVVELVGIEHDDVTVRTLAVQKDGKILVTGVVKLSDADHPVFVARYLENGHVDRGFADQGTAIITLTADWSWKWVEALAVREHDGAIAVAGNLSRGRFRKGWIVVLNASGSVNLVFNGGKTLYTDMLPEGVAWIRCEWLAGNVLLVCGDGGDGTVNPDTSMLIARYLADGAPDTSFNETGWTAFKNPHGSVALRDCVVMEDQRIVVSGETGGRTGYVLRYHG